MGSALEALGELYRNAEGVEVWRIRDRAGVICHEDVASDFDAEFLAEQLFTR